MAIESDNSFVKLQENLCMISVRGRILFLQRSYPEIFFNLRETTACDLLQQKFEDHKYFTVKTFGQFLKVLTVKLPVSKNKTTSHPDILIEVCR